MRGTSFLVLGLVTLAFLMIGITQGTWAESGIMLNSSFHQSTKRPIVALSIDQGMANGLVVNQDLDAVGRIVEAVKPLEAHYDVYLLLNPSVRKDRLEPVLDEIARLGGKFMLDVYSSDVFTLADVNEPYDRYGARAISPEKLREYIERYGKALGGIRLFELIGQQEITPDHEIVREEWLREYLQIAREHGLFAQWGEFSWGRESARYQELINPVIREYSDVLILTFNNNGVYRMADGPGMVMGYHEAYGVRWGISNQTWYWLHAFDRDLYDTLMPFDVFARFIVRALAEGASFIQVEPVWYLFDIPRMHMRVNNYVATDRRGEPKKDFERLKQLLLLLAKLPVREQPRSPIAVYLPNVRHQGWLGGSLLFPLWMAAYESPGGRLESDPDLDPRRRLVELGVPETNRVTIPVLPYDVDVDVVKRFDTLIVPMGTRRESGSFTTDDEQLYDRLSRFSQFVDLFLDSPALFAATSRRGELTMIRGGDLSSLTGLRFPQLSAPPIQWMGDIQIANPGGLGLDPDQSLYARAVEFEEVHVHGAETLIPSLLYEFENEWGRRVWTMSGWAGLDERDDAYRYVLRRLVEVKDVPALSGAWIYPYETVSATLADIERLVPDEALHAFDTMISFRDDDGVELVVPETRTFPSGVPRDALTEGAVLWRSK